MKVLVLNCGSSSVKFQLFDVDTEEVLAKGLVEKIGSSDAIVTYVPMAKEKMVQTREILNYDTALNLVFSALMHPEHGVIKSKTEIGAVGHRIVHGGEEFAESVVISDEVKEGVRRCIQFAPLHNPYNLKGIEVCEQILGGVPQVGVFDTAFHCTLPARAYMYALPMALYRKLGIRRYGFHGTSHGYVARRAAQYIGLPIEKLKMITCHLGNGCSITAVDGGRSVDTSMGFTPLEGLVMGTRCGDMDPALVSYIAQKEGLSLAQVDTILNKRSGMLGLTETSNDLREICLDAEHGSDQHRLALEIFCYRVRKYIGSYAAAMGGLDAIVFTAGIGENSAHVRKMVLSDLGFLGVEIDQGKNERNDFDIGTGTVKILVVPTNEELAIARDTKRVLGESLKPAMAVRPEEVGSRRSEALTADDKAELMALWIANPHATLEELSQRVGRRLDREVSPALIDQQLRAWGLDRVSDKKRMEILTRSA